MEQLPESKRRDVIATLAVLLFIVVIMSAVVVTNKKKTTTADTTGATAATATPTTSTATTGDPSTSPTITGNAVATAGYKDGSYTATGSYDSSGGTEAITVQVTLQGGVVTATSAHANASDAEAEEYQALFITNYKQLVVGKNIANIRLSRVSGSSLTSQGFNDAIEQIKSKARS